MNTSALHNPSGRALLTSEEYRPLDRMFIAGLVTILLGYAFLSKGLAQLHIPVGFPLYVGEMVLALGLAAAVLRPRMFGRVPACAPVAMYLLFASWGAVRTLPFFSRYGVNAGRDAALYYYGSFMFLAIEVVRDRRALEWIARGYARLFRWYPVWILAVVGITVLGIPVPNMPGTSFSMLHLRAGDRAIHVLGATAFFILVPATREDGQRRHDDAGTWWYATSVVAGLSIFGRAAYLAIGSGLSAAWLFARRDTFWKPVAGGILCLVLLLLVNPSVQIGKREFTLERALGYVQSIYAKTGDPENKEGTKQWRLKWWGVIADETFSGPYFWTGRGFGENIAVAHGYEQPGAARPLRSPHSCHMTVLSRMGVPGAVLWLGFLWAFISHIYSRWRRARDAGDRFLQGVIAWAMCYWIAILVDASFSVSLEGPMEGIWFWSVAGFALAAGEMPPRASAANGQVA